MNDAFIVTSGAGAVRLRPERDDDHDFRFALFQASRPLSAVLDHLPQAQREALLRQQFMLQTQSYRQAFPDAAGYIAVLGDAPVGRILVGSSAAALHVIDVAIVPEQRGRGIGTAVLGCFMMQARLASLTLRLTVASDNLAARRWYARLGFAVTAASLTDLALQWPSADAAPGDAGAGPGH